MVGVREVTTKLKGAAYRLSHGLGHRGAVDHLQGTATRTSPSTSHTRVDGSCCSFSGNGASEATLLL
jgi:hypothetical protein